MSAQDGMTRETALVDFLGQRAWVSADGLHLVANHGNPDRVDFDLGMINGRAKLARLLLGVTEEEIAEVKLVSRFLGKIATPDESMEDALRALLAKLDPPHETTTHPEAT